MPRTFRFYEKKRGHRRTGSPGLATAGELIFFGTLSAIGFVGLTAMIALWVVPDWRVNYDFIETPGRILDAQVVEETSERGPIFRPEVLVEYEVAGQRYQQWAYGIQRTPYPSRARAEDALRPFESPRRSDLSIPCWYDPLNPRIVVVSRGFSWWLWLALAVPAAFLVGGTGGLVYSWVTWGRSAEHAAALARRVQRGNLFRGEGGERVEFPFMPDDAEIQNSPGTRLTYRLPIGNSPGWALVTSLFAAVAWNGLVIAWAVVAIAMRHEGKLDWLQIFFLVPFSVIGVGLIGWFVRQLLVTVGIGPTIVEIDAHPFRPGGRYRLFLSQAGNLRLARLRVDLICVEEATFRQGTNTRTETREVLRETVFEGSTLNVDPRQPFETECDLVVPLSAMHSFRADYNAVCWKLVIRGESQRWSRYTRVFPLVVRPAPLVTA